VITVGAIVGLFLLPTPFLQYYLTFIPLLTLFAGALLVRLAAAAADSSANPFAVRLALVLTLALVLAGALTIAPIQFRSPAWSPMLEGWLPAHSRFLFAIFAGAGLVFMFRLPAYALALLLIAVSINPYCWMLYEFTLRSNDRQLHQMRVVLENTAPKDTVMDGRTGLGAFRPEAWPYSGGVDASVRALLTRQDRQRLLDDLRSGKIAPRVVLLDTDLLLLFTPVTIFFLRNYVPMPGEDPIYFRKGELHELESKVKPN